AGTSHRLPRAIGAGHALPVVALGRGGQDGNTAGVAGNLLHDPVLHAGDQVEGGGREPCSGGQAGSTKWSARTAAASPCDCTPRKNAAPAARRSGSPSPCQSTNPGGYTAKPCSDPALRYGTTILRVCGAWPQERATTNSASVRAPVGGRLLPGHRHQRLAIGHAPDAVRCKEAGKSGCAFHRFPLKSIGCAPAGAGRSLHLRPEDRQSEHASARAIATGTAVPTMRP